MHRHRNTLATKTSGMQILRQKMNTVLPLIGMGIILGVALLKRELQDAALIVLGVFLIEIGVLKLAHKMLPEQREYHALRAHTNQFLMLVRQLNTAALRVKEHDTPENRWEIEEIRQQMQQMIDCLVATAGKTDAELATEAGRARQEDLSQVTI